MPFRKSKAPEDSEPPEINPTIEADPEADDESTSGSDAEEEAPAAAASESGPSRPSKKKKKKKKRSKIARAISAIKGDSVPQAVVDQVVAKVKEEHGEDSPAADEETVRDLLKQLKLKDVAEGKAGFGGKNKKDTGDHKVCYPCSECIRFLSGIDVAQWRSSGRRNPYHTTVRHIYPVCELCSPVFA
jgi:glycylpeptide N-tetradecanoyltransferase